MSEIIRLRGEGTPLVWTPAMEGLLGPCRLLRMETTPAFAGDWSAYREAWRRWQVVFDDAATRAADAFGRAQGWTLAAPGPRVPPPHDPNDEHQQEWVAWVESHVSALNWYRRERRCAGLVLHASAPLPMDLVPEGLVVDALPESWHSPADALAYAIRTDDYTQQTKLLASRIREKRQGCHPNDRNDP